MLLYILHTSGKHNIRKLQLIYESHERETKKSSGGFHGSDQMNMIYGLKTMLPERSHSL